MSRIDDYFSNAPTVGEVVGDGVVGVVSDGVVGVVSDGVVGEVAEERTSYAIAEHA